MDASFQAIKGLYQDEINAYKRQIEELKARNKSSDEKNANLLGKVHELQNLIEKANVANQDLHTAFEHVREENMKLLLHSNNQDSSTFRSGNDEMALETVQRQYINLARESVSWISDKDKLVQRIKFLERECERYNRDNRTLGKQVRHLLKTLEEERGTIIRRAEQLNESERQPVSAADVIDKHLVTFESIEELQQQNQKLLSLVKELSKKEEEREIQVENDDIRRLNGELESLKSQLDTVKNERERIITAFNTILKERDLFKILLCKTRQVEHLTPEVFQRMVTIACSAGPAITNQPENTQDKEAHIVDLKAMISKLEQELADLRSESENVRIRNEEEIKLKTGLLEQAHLKILSESQQSEALKERNNLLESNITSLTAEFDEVRTKSQKLIFELEQVTKDKKDLATALEEEKQRRQSELSIMLGQMQERAQVSELKDMISGLNQELINLGEEFKSARAESQDDINSRLEEAQVKILRYSEELKELRESNHSLESTIGRARAEYAQLELLVQRCKGEMQQLTLESEQAKAGNRDLAEALDNANRLRQSEVSRLLGQLNERANLSPKEYSSLQQELADLREELKCARAENSGDLKLEQTQLKFHPKFKDLQSKIVELRNEIIEIQRLRSVERRARLKLAKKAHSLEDCPKTLTPSDATLKRKENDKPDDKTNKPPERMIILKRRKIV